MGYGMGYDGSVLGFVNTTWDPRSVCVCVPCSQAGRPARWNWWNERMDTYIVNNIALNRGLEFEEDNVHERHDETGVRFGA